MKNFISILLLLLLFTPFGQIDGKNPEDNQVDKKSKDYFVKVVGITDGDTFSGLTGDKQL